MVKTSEEISAVLQPRINTLLLLLCLIGGSAWGQSNGELCGSAQPIQAEHIDFLRSSTDGWMSANESKVEIRFEQGRAKLIPNITTADLEGYAKYKLKIQKATPNDREKAAINKIVSSARSMLNISLEGAFCIRPDKSYFLAAIGIGEIGAMVVKSLIALTPIPQADAKAKKQMRVVLDGYPITVTN